MSHSQPRRLSPHSSCGSLGCREMTGWSTNNCHFDFDMLLRKEGEEEEVGDEEEVLKTCNDSGRHAERWSGGRTVWMAVKLMRPWKDLETGRVCLVIMVKTCVTNYHVQSANEHRLPDHAVYSITGERAEERASRREKREKPGSFSPSVTFRLMRPRRGGYFLILTGWCPHTLKDAFLSSCPHLRCRCGQKKRSV